MQNNSYTLWFFNWESLGTLTYTEASPAIYFRPEDAAGAAWMISNINNGTTVVIRDDNSREVGYVEANHVA